MKKISAKDWAKLNEAHGSLESIKAEVETYLAEVKDRLDAFEAQIEEVRAAAHEVLEEIATSAASFQEGRSEKWQESDTGQQYADWVREIEDARDGFEDSIGLSIELEELVEPIEAAIANLGENIRQSPDD